jgi:hypothetical protein
MTEPRMTHDEAIDLAAGYVLHALEPVEDAAVREHLGTCGLPHPEFEELGGVVPALLELDESELVEPPAALRDRILAAAAADVSRADAPASAGVPSTPIPFPTTAERDERSTRRSGASRLDWAIRIAAVVAIVALGAWGIGLQRQLDANQAFNQAVANVLTAASQPGAKVVVLAPEPGQQGSGLAAVQPDGSMVLAMHDLPANGGSEVYTAWVIVGSNAPTSVGDFSVGSTGVQSFTTHPTSTPEGATIAITREPNPGNQAPKGPIVSAGVATAPAGATS